ncbi:ATP-binding protein [Colwellia psychrerythraea]|uniref:ATP-binding region ATPase domain protein n=1 Tax=Colwellia psychrerythraea TaxID=28229 RepID=A0A099KW75_COLPS|nr:ATP-binding protein [Colwellia psychrerythraea]KGJ94445.1 ATP-binding region ATPase domain protein [Colwellia psychrerythraea]
MRDEPKQSNKSNKREENLCARIALNTFLNIREQAVIDMADSGKAVDNKNMTQIFVPLFTTKKEGSDIGLALTKQLMLAQDSKVAVRNNKQGDATYSCAF